MSEPSGISILDGLRRNVAASKDRLAFHRVPSAIMGIMVSPQIQRPMVYPGPFPQVRWPVPRPVKHVRYPWNAPRRRPMTIAAGFRVQDGVLICADTMYTGAMKILK